MLSKLGISRGDKKVSGHKMSGLGGHGWPVQLIRKKNNKKYIKETIKLWKRKTKGDSIKVYMKLSCNYNSCAKKFVKSTFITFWLRQSLRTAYASKEVIT